MVGRIAYEERCTLFRDWLGVFDTVFQSHFDFTLSQITRKTYSFILYQEFPHSAHGLPNYKQKDIVDY